MSKVTEKTQLMVDFYRRKWWWSVWLEGWNKANHEQEADYIDTVGYDDYDSAKHAGLQFIETLNLMNTR